MIHDIIIAHSAGTGASSEFSCYKDGTPTGSATINTLASTDCKNNVAVSIGAESDGGGITANNTRLSRFQVYPYKLTQAQVTEVSSDDVVCVTSLTNATTSGFKVYKWNVSQEEGTGYGQLTLSLHDHDNLLTDPNDSRRPCLIKNEYRIVLYAGKSAPTSAKWFEGRIREPGVLREPQLQYIELFATGMGTLLDRNTRIAMNQAKDADDPLVIDSTDETANVSNVAIQMIENVENYLNPSLPVLPFSTHGIEDNEVKIVNFDKRPATQIQVGLTELANMSGQKWGVDYSDMSIWMRYAGSIGSGMLITNELDSTLAQNWDVDKICILLKRARKYVDSTIGFATPYIYALGGLTPSFDMSQPNADASLDLSARDHAIAFTPTKDNVWIIAPFLSRTGTPSAPLTVSLIGSDSSGDPDLENIIQSRIITPERLQRLSVSGEYLEIEFDRVSVAPKTKLFVYIPTYADATNKIELDYLTGSGEYWTAKTEPTTNIVSSLGAGGVEIWITATAHGIAHLQGVTVKNHLLNTNANGHWKTDGVTANTMRLAWPDFHDFRYGNADGGATGTVQGDPVWLDPAVGANGKMVGSAKMRIYSAKQIQINYTNCSLDSKYGNTNYPKEMILPVQGLHEDLVIDMLPAISRVRSRQGRYYEPILIYPPKDPVKLGRTARYIDKYNGLDIQADIVAYSMGGDVEDLAGSGAVTMEIKIVEAIV